VLPLVSTRQAIGALERMGWLYERFRNGHHVLSHSGKRMIISLPDRRELSRGLLRRELNKADIKEADFIAALNAG
jgi:predicted RNA binding protein YcfA (HicA-like mRNA interferase family)